ncbi:MAG: M23 family metallopeptidase [Polaromonas sp.]|nr:M23 family metallopeptidase [Polaromonas sp.]
MQTASQVVSAVPAAQSATSSPSQPSATAAPAPPAMQSDPLTALIEKLAPSSSATTSTPAAALADPMAGEADISVLRPRALTPPVQGVSAAQLTDTYTQTRAAGAPHEALDIMAARGTPVLAVEDGKVVKLFLSKPGGITIYQFDPQSHYAYYYAHLDRYADGLVEGASLRKGQVIGYVGTTGNASPNAPHLHFAIFKLDPEGQWWRGTPLNPYLVWRDPKP